MEYYVTQPKDYWIASSAVNITLNALGEKNRIQGSVASESVIMCFVESIKAESEGGEPGNGDGLWYGPDHEPKRWPLTLSPTYFNSETHKYVYVAIPRSTSVGSQAVIVFPSEELDIYGRARRLQNDVESYEQIGSTDYFYVWLHGIISAPQYNAETQREERGWEDPITDRDWGILETAQGREEQQGSSDWFNYSQISQVVTFLKEIVMNSASSFRNLILNHKNLTDVATSDAVMPIDSDTMVATPNYVAKFYLSKVSDDTAAGKITFQQGLKSEGTTELEDTTVDGDIRSKDFSSGMPDGYGWKIDERGNGEFESLRIRSALEVIELLINRQQAQEGDTLFAPNDQIERVEKFVDEVTGETSYILTFKEKWEGYITAQQYGNILRGVINTLAAKEAGVSDVEPSDPGQEDDGKNKYFTSFMQLLATHDEDNTLGLNQVRVVLYGDDLVPAGKNFEPCKMMVVARRGCFLDPDETGISDAEKKSRRARQTVIAISTSDGRFIKLTNVDAPILRDTNYGTTLGLVPDFVKEWYYGGEPLAHKLEEGRDYLYAQGIIVQDFIKVDRQGNPKIEYIDCKEWVDGSTMAEPTPGHGIYLANEYNEETGQWETHDVWHDGKKWRCLQHQPVLNAGVYTYHEPKWNSLYWRMIEGNSNYELDFSSSNGYRFRRGYVNTVITPYLYYGDTDISADIAEQYWSWKRESENGASADTDPTWNARHQHMRSIQLTDDDMPSCWSVANRIIFTCTCTLLDGDNRIIIDNRIIA